MRWGDGYRKLCKRYNEPATAHELTFSCYRQRPFLRSERTCEWLAAAIERARASHAVHLWAYVFMPEHVHLLVWPVEDAYDISAFLRTVKQSVARKALIHLRRNQPAGLAQLATGQKHAPYRFWQDGGGYDRNIRRVETCLAMVEYIHNNPVRRRLVESTVAWPWSSARSWETGIDEPLPIDRESFPA